MSDFIKQDKDYDSNISFIDGRPFAKGHSNFNFSSDDTEVEALIKIFDEYLDTTSISSAMKISEHKIDFSTNVIDTMIISMKDKLDRIYKFYDGIETELHDVSHRIIKPALSGEPISIDKKLQIYGIQEDLLLQRRKLKDAINILKVSIENMEKTRNFMLSMNRRMYSPKSERFQHNKDFYIGTPVSDTTRINTIVNKEHVGNVVK